MDRTVARVSLESQGQLAPLVRTVNLVRREKLDLPARLELLDSQDLRDHQVFLETLEHRDLKVTQAETEYQAQQEKMG